MMDIPDKRWVTSKDVLMKTGISRATLNNYIKMGILPRPVVQNPGKDMQSTKQIGYFPENVISLIMLVKRLKQEGEPMENIARQFVENSGKLEMFPRSAKPDTTVHKTEADCFIPEQNSISDTQTRRSPSDSLVEDLKHAPAPERYKPLTLTISQLDMPAYLINNNFEVEWINAEAEDQIFNRNVCSITEIESRNIFKLFFSFEFHSHLSNWKEIISFHMPFVQSKFPKVKLPGLYQGISDSEVRFLSDLYDEMKLTQNKAIDGRPTHLVSPDGSVKYYQVYTMMFREGTFFVYAPTDRRTNDVMEYLSRRELVIHDLLKQRMPALVSLCVLVADLQDSVKISAELLPGEYFSLINKLWESLAGCFDKYGGIYGKHAGDGMLYYFIKKPGTDYVMNSINCALDLKNAMRKFSSEWKIKKGWIEDMYLNIGINEGQEFFGTIRSAPTIEFTALGDSINYAGRLSDFARYGEIWTTKSVISKLDPEGLNCIRFGVTRKMGERTLFTPNAFSRVMDLMGNDDKKYGKFIDIATLPITQIMENAG
jgi:adenylate cyclase